MNDDYNILIIITAAISFIYGVYSYDFQHKENNKKEKICMAIFLSIYCFIVYLILMYLLYTNSFKS